MRTVDLIGSAVSNTFRSKTRTILTILAIFVGAFTLTLTSGLGTGINAYIDDTVTSIGAADVMTVTKTQETATGVAADGPVEYDPDIVKVSIVGLGMRSHAGVAAKMFGILASEGINIQAISTSEIKISCIIAAKYTELAVRALHKAFGLEQPG